MLNLLAPFWVKVCLLMGATADLTICCWFATTGKPRGCFFYPPTHAAAVLEPDVFFDDTGV
jgi:hypothetical protein